MASAVSVPASDITYFQTETSRIGRGDGVGFAARAPPIAMSNVAITGGVTVMQGSAFTLHKQETVAALFSFECFTNVTNSVLNLTKSGTLTNRYPGDDVWRKILGSSVRSNKAVDAKLGLNR